MVDIHVRIDPMSEWIETQSLFVIDLLLVRE